MYDLVTAVSKSWRRQTEPNGEFKNVLMLGNLFIHKQNHTYARTYALMLGEKRNQTEKKWRGAGEPIGDQNVTV